MDGEASANARKRLSANRLGLGKLIFQIGQPLSEDGELVVFTGAISNPKASHVQR